MIGIGQIITAEMNNSVSLGAINIPKGEKEIITIDITKDISVEFISIVGNEGNWLYPSSWQLDFGRKTKKGKPYRLKISAKASKVLDGNAKIKLVSEMDVINFFAKYGYDYKSSDTKTSTRSSGGDLNTYTGVRTKQNVSSSSITTITFQNNNN
tara:strand:- start:64 stop:525 length:462 start_codon:yes stop_codon:yes gene_type:complete